MSMDKEQPDWLQFHNCLDSIRSDISDILKEMKNIRGMDEYENHMTDMTAIELYLDNVDDIIMGVMDSVTKK